MKVKPIVAHVTKQRLGRYGHIRQRDPEDIARMVLDKERDLPVEAGPASDGRTISGEI